MKEVKCEHCGQWTDGMQEHCQHCNGLLNEKYIAEKKEQEKVETGMKFPLIEIDENDPILLKGGKYVIRAGQVVFFAIVTAVAYLAAGTVG